MKCPSCSTPLSEKTVAEGLGIDVCDRCKGIWFDRNELQRFLGNLAVDDGKPERPRILESEFRIYTFAGIETCPCCEVKTLQHVNFEGLDASRCTECSGIFVSKRQLRNYEIEVGVRTDIWKYPVAVLDFLHLILATMSVL